MENCIFCKIVNNEIPSYKIYEDDNFLAFLDISQTTKGHTLVIPKKHITDIFEATSSETGQIFEVVNILAKDICKKLNAKGVNILNNNKLAAGQTVFHFHVHIIPRYDINDNITIKLSENNFDVSEIHKLLI